MNLKLKVRKWSAGDKPDAAWDRLNDAWKELVANIVGRINKDIATKTVVFTGPAATLTFASGTTIRPTGVSLVSLYRTDTSATSAVTFSWTYANGQVSTTSFSGLAAAEWSATFLILGAV